MSSKLLAVAGCWLCLFAFLVADNGSWRPLGRGIGSSTSSITYVDIATTDNAQTIINAHPAGTAFRLLDGTHRMQTIAPRVGDSYTGQSMAGTIFSGARLLTSPNSNSGNWFYTGQTQQGNATGNCQASPPFTTAHPGCIYPEDLFFDNVIKEHVTSLGALSAGKWYFDYGADRIYVADDPTGHVVETSVTTSAFTPTANNVSITNMTIEKFASEAQFGAILATSTSGWQVTNCDIRYNHSGGIRIGNSLYLASNHIHHNGQEGPVGVGSNVTVYNNEVDHNNTVYFDPGWEAGGSKFVSTTNLNVNSNYFHDNQGPGIWMDIDNIYVTVQNNTSNNNAQQGIMHEISYDAVIKNNTVVGNGFGEPGWGCCGYDWILGAGILVAESPNVEVFGNTVQDNGDGIGGRQTVRGSGAYGPHEISNLYVHDNAVRMIAGPDGWTGLVENYSPPDHSFFTTRNNRFLNNTYTGGSAVLFTWLDGADLTLAQWNAYGQQ